MGLLTGADPVLLAEVRDGCFGVDHLHPVIAPWGWEAEGQRFVVSVEEDVEAVVDDGLPVLIGYGEGLTVEEETDGAGKAVLPVLVRHDLAVGAEPADVAGAGAVQRTAHKPAATLEDRMLVAEVDDPGEEGQQLTVLLIEGVLPVEPGELIVLAVGVVVASLRAADLVAAVDHRPADGEQQGAEEVALLAGAQDVDLLAIGGSFLPAVPGAVVSLAVVSPLSAGPVLLLSL